MSFQAFIYVCSSRPLLNRGEWKNITHEVNIDRWDTVAMVINDNDFDKKTDWFLQTYSINLMGQTHKILKTCWPYIFVENIEKII